jgi:hypothetical protein
MKFATHQQAIETETASGYEAARDAWIVDAYLIVSAPRQAHLVVEVKLL